MSTIPSSHLQLRSTVKPDATLDLRLEAVETPMPEPDGVIVRVEASPINPSDLGMLLGGADIATASATGSGEETAVTATIPPAMMTAMAARVGQSMPAGNEGAGVVVAAGDAPEAQALMGKTVAILGGAMYSQYRGIRANQCLLLPDGTTPAEGAACFVNPLTVLGMLGTMRHEGHTALVHTAAASNLGQMLQKACLQDGVKLVNIVRKPEQVELLRSLGAEYVCNSSEESFRADLVEALAATGATLGFDATGGGSLASEILGAMEQAALRTSSGAGRYGSTVHKQVYIYGGLDRTPTKLIRNFGMAWGIGGWLLGPFLERVGREEAQSLRERVAHEITTTFASSYAEHVSLVEMLQPAEMAIYGRMATGEKYLVTPNAGL